MLGVSSLVDLLDAYKMTASKVLSLWQKQAEQESDVEKLEEEIRSLQSAVEEQLEARAGENVRRPLSIPRLRAALDPTTVGRSRSCHDR